MRFYKSISLAFCFFLLFGISNAQKMSNVLLQKGDNAYAQMQYAEAMINYKQAYQKQISATGSIQNIQQKENTAVKIADCYWLMRNLDSAYQWYSKVSETYPDSTGRIRVRKAELNAIRGDYKQAADQLSGLPEYASRADGFLKVNKMLVDSADWTLHYAQNINTDYFREFSPMLIDSGMTWATNQPTKFNKNSVMGWDNMGYARILNLLDTSTLLAADAPLSRKLLGERKPNANNPDYLSIHFAGADVEQLSPVVVPKALTAKMKYIDSITVPILGLESLSYNLAHSTFNPISNKVYFSANRQDKLKDQLRTVALVEADKKDNAFVNPKFILGVDNKFSTMHPAIHPNGTTLVFSSNMAGGKGGFDLYYTVKQSDDSWSTPSPVVGANTQGNELFATFSPDGNFYFSSDGLKGLGGLDVHKAKFKNGKVTELTHLSYPLNSAYDDFGLSFKADNKSGYFTSDRYGSDDILTFVFEEVHIKINGFVKSENTGKGVPGINAVYHITDDEGVTTVLDSMLTDATGKYSFNGRPNRDYIVKVIAGDDSKTMAFTSKNIFDKIQLDTVIIHDKEPVKEVVPPVVVVPQFADTLLYIVYFDFDKFAIKQDAKSTLEDVVSTLNEDLELKITLWGHADQSGKDAYNDRLSLARTSSVLKYLQAAGIESSRIRLASFGETKPVIDGATKKQARFNRRVEISIRK